MRISNHTRPSVPDEMPHKAAGCRGRWDAVYEPEDGKTYLVCSGCQIGYDQESEEEEAEWG